MGQTRTVDREAGAGRKPARACTRDTASKPAWHIDYLRKQIKQADNDLDREVRNSPLWDRYELLSSVPGVGRVLSVALLSDLPELGRLNRC
jgi:transposase